MNHDIEDKYLNGFHAVLNRIVKVCGEVFRSDAPYFNELAAKQNSNHFTRYICVYALLPLTVPAAQNTLLVLATNKAQDLYAFLIDIMKCIMRNETRSSSFTGYAKSIHEKVAGVVSAIENFSDQERFKQLEKCKSSAAYLVQVWDVLVENSKIQTSTAASALQQMRAIRNFVSNMPRTNYLESFDMSVPRAKEISEIVSDIQVEVDIHPMGFLKCIPGIPNVTGELFAYQILVHGAVQNVGVYSEEYMNKVWEIYNTSMFEHVFLELKGVPPEFGGLLGILQNIRRTVLQISKQKQNKVIQEILDVDFIHSRCQVAAFNETDIEKLVTSLLHHLPAIFNMPQRERFAASISKVYSNVPSIAAEDNKIRCFINILRVIYSECRKVVTELHISTYASVSLSIYDFLVTYRKGKFFEKFMSQGNVNPLPHTKNFIHAAMVSPEAQIVIQNISVPIIAGSSSSASFLSQLSAAAPRSGTLDLSRPFRAIERRSARVLSSLPVSIPFVPKDGSSKSDASSMLLSPEVPVSRPSVRLTPHHSSFSPSVSAESPGTTAVSNTGEQAECGSVPSLSSPTASVVSASLQKSSRGKKHDLSFLSSSVVGSPVVPLSVDSVVSTTASDSFVASSVSSPVSQTAFWFTPPDTHCVQSVGDSLVTFMPFQLNHLIRVSIAKLVFGVDFKSIDNFPETLLPEYTDLQKLHAEFNYLVQCTATLDTIAFNLPMMPGRGEVLSAFASDILQAPFAPVRREVLFSKASLEFIIREKSPDYVCVPETVDRLFKILVHASQPQNAVHVVRRKRFSAMWAREVTLDPSSAGGEVTSVANDKETLHFRTMRALRFLRKICVHNIDVHGPLYEEMAQHWKKSMVP